MHHATLQQASPSSGRDHDVTDAKYRGRHRARRRSAVSPRIVGTGLVLPTTATLAIVSMTNGAPMTLASSTPTGLSAVDDAAADQAELAQDKASDTAGLTRGVQDRVARDSERSRLDAVTAENKKRAAAEAALAASNGPMKVTLVGAKGSDTGAEQMYAGPFGPKTWVNPISAGYHLSSPFGWRWGRLHAGQDMACPVGTAVHAISSGVVIFAGWQGGYGYKVEIRHWDGTVSYYGHNSKLKVTEGQSVATGQLIALSGNTGHSTGPHLHLEIHPNGGGPVPPAPWMKARGAAL